MPERTQGGDWQRSSNKLNLNGANVDQLLDIDGIDRETAELIVQYRRTNGAFETYNDLHEIAGVDETQYSVLRQRTEI